LFFVANRACRIRSIISYFVAHAPQSPGTVAVHPHGGSVCVHARKSTANLKHLVGTLYLSLLLHMSTVN
jgi:hypothetical protein